MSIELPDDTATRAVASIKRYVSEELDHDIGDLKAQLFLQFILKEIAPSVYNGALADAQVYLHERVSDLEGACGAAEFGYWPPSVVRRGKTS